ncbi:uncharacterized protein NEMAJ01_2251 [Nematocida major]|uniref:uncharacterized protein n=1 Tax=Nematocida major TaxID=1912982 RepID=UPI0020088A22|nr:uncharacterized protein NEMAJ01_2251 [Nematocida major]KAH9387355.1 hypothetical protein NEMAJ01_2251 [Nematocida major]
MKKTPTLLKQVPRACVKRQVPEAWQDMHHYEEETTAEEETRLFKEIRMQLKNCSIETTVFKRKTPSSSTRVLSNMCLYSAFSRVIYLVETGTGLFPLEAYSKDLPLINRKSIKKPRYTFKSLTPKAILSDSMKIAASIYEVEGKYLRRGEAYISQRVPLLAGLRILNRLLLISVEINKPVLDPESVYVQEEGGVNALYIPVERLHVETMEYKIFLAGLVINTHTVMERVEIVKNILQGGETQKEEHRILKSVYAAMASTEWSKKYSEISGSIVQYMGTPQ